MRLPHVLISFYRAAMPIETLGQAYNAHWKMNVACDGCDIRERVDMRALLWTRGKDMPLEQLKDRLKCPRCGSRIVKVAFEPPGRGQPASKDLVAVPGRYLIEQLDLRGQVVETLKRDRFEAAKRCFKKQVERRRGGRFLMRDGGRVILQWPERDT